MDCDPQGCAKGPGCQRLQLVLGILCMVMVANLQYGWAVFVAPIDAKFAWGRTAIQIAFTIFVLTETWLMPVTGYLADRFGPRLPVMAGGILTGISWGLNAYAESLAILYFSAAVGGIGAGAVYSACIGNALKWFGDQRGLAVGLTAAGFGTVSAATVLLIHATIQARGYENAFLYFGVGQALIVVLAASRMAAPATQGARGIDGSSDAPGYGPLEVIRAPAFWLMYLMFFLVATAGLLAISQLAPIAKEYKIANTPASILDLTLPALTFALAIDRVFSGLSRPFFGWVSDRIGREPAMAIAFGCEALAIVALAWCGSDPLAFVLLTAAIFFCWGEIYSLFPAASADSFGARCAATHAGILYTAKGAAALLVLLLSQYVPQTVDSRLILYFAAALNVWAAVLAVTTLVRLRARLHAGDWRKPLPG